MGILRTGDKLRGIVTATTSTPGHREHVWANKRITFTDGSDEYDHNIQIADLNMLNAVFAVIRWKKLYRVYADDEHELHRPGILEALMPGRVQSHACTAEVPPMSCVSAVRVVLEIRQRDGKGHGEIARVGRQLGRLSPAMPRTSPAPARRGITGWSHGRFDQGTAAGGPGRVAGRGHLQAACSAGAHEGSWHRPDHRRQRTGRRGCGGGTHAGRRWHAGGGTFRCLAEAGRGSRWPERASSRMAPRVVKG
jgi:hypothetical protein